MLSTFKQRARDSANAQMQGLFGKDFTWPLPEDLFFEMSQPTQEDDFLMRPDDDSCKRVDDVENAIENNEDTDDLFANVTTFLEKGENGNDQAGFFDRLRTLTDMNDADSETMFDVADYILWALANDMKLKFDLTTEDLRYIKLADESGNYEDYAAQPDQKQLGTWEL